MNNNNKFDVIIVGSGIGGLAVASLLSDRFKVLVLEKNRAFGGYCSSFSREGYIFESAIQAVNGMYPNNVVYNVLKKTRVLDKNKFINPNYLYRTIFPDYDFKVPQQNILEYKASLIKLFPDETQGIKNIFYIMKEIFLEMNRFHDFFEDKMIFKSPVALKYYKSSCKDLLDEYIKNIKLKAIIAQYWIYRGLPPSKLSAIIFSYIWYDYTANGSYYPAKGMRAIISSLIDSIKENGGEVLGKAEVSEYVVKGNKVLGLKLKNGETFTANNFISNTDVFKTIKMLKNGRLEEIEKFRHRLEKNNISISAFKIYLGLNIDLRTTGIDDYEIFVSPSYDMETMYKDSIDNKLDKTPFAITIYSNLVKGVCKNNKSVLSIGLLSGYDYWKKMDKKEYSRKKEELADVVISRCEKIIPNLKKYIDQKIIATPLTMERYTDNINGSAYGWNKKNLEEEIAFMNPTTPIKNLFLSSHWELYKNIY